MPAGLRYAIAARPCSLHQSAPPGAIRGVFVVAARPCTFDRFREEMTRPRLSDFDMR